MKSRFGNLLTFLVALAAQLAVVWQDGNATFVDKCVASGAAALGLLLSKARLKEVEQIAIAVLTAGATVLAVAATHLSTGSKVATIASVVAMVVTSLRTLVATQAAGGAAVVLLGFLAFHGAACHNTKPDQFFNAVVDCAKVNPEASPALAAVETCLMSTLSGNPSACLSGLLTEAHFTVDEIACVVAYLAQVKNARVAADIANLDDLAVRQAANDWLVQEKIAIRNSYSSK